MRRAVEMSDNVTIGEVYRRLVDMDERYDAKLSGIDAQVRITNGRTTKLETQMDMANREIRDIKRATRPPATPPSLPDMNESIKLTISPNMWKLIAGGLGAAAGLGFPAIVRWLSQL